MAEDTCEITCIVCPWGCQVKLTVKEGKIRDMEGNKCHRGVEYVKQEFYNPQRVLTTTVKLKGSRLPLLPVRTNKPIPKKMLGECMRYLANIEVKALVKLGQVIVPNILGTGANIISTRNLDSD
jgi:CxxC motif-containing protein